MEYKDQLILHGPDKIGDCFRACLATIIGKQVLAVPHFALLGHDHFMSTAIGWLSLHGYEVDTDPDGYDSEGLKPLPLHVMRGLGGRGVRHAVVGDTATGKMVHDPHPSREGLLVLESRLYLFPRR